MTEFTNFPRNPKTKNRNGKVIWCRKCCQRYIEENGDDSETLKTLLKIIDVPYIEKLYQSAKKSLEKKRKNTNIVTKVNIADNKIIEEKTESLNIQSNLYTCYVAKVGLIPKSYIDYSYSDGIRIEEEYTILTEEEIENKEIEKQRKYLTKLFTKDIYDDEDRLYEAIQIKLKELKLYKQDASKNTIRWKIKTSVNKMVDCGELTPRFSLLFDKKKKNEEIFQVEYKEEEVEIPNILEENPFDVKVLREKWGMDYKINDLIQFEKEYNKLIKNYVVKTATHDLYLKQSCIASVKANQCMARNDIASAEKWIKMLDTSTKAGKLQPQQLSKVDLNGGLNGFGEFYSALEKSKGAIEILPRYKIQPRDDVDMVIFCNINYMRLTKGLPKCKYKEIYDFTEKMYEEMNDLGLLLEDDEDDEYYDLSWEEESKEEKIDDDILEDDE